MNLQEKLSGLKGLVSQSHSKRRHKGDLTVDMISPPLGDFRHTMHVGRGGDVFGDTSFLSNHGGTANGSNGDTDSISSPDNKIGAFFSRTLRQIRRGSDHRPREGSKDLSPAPPAVSPIIKNAISLPRLDLDVPNGSPTTKVLFPSSQSTPEENKSTYGLESGFITLPRLSRSERQQPSISDPASCSPNVHRGSLTDPDDPILSTCSTSYVTSDPKRSTAFSDSLPSLTSLDAFTFDLGPSLMSEVFSLIDGHSEERLPTWDGLGSACGLPDQASEIGRATISQVDFSLRKNDGHGKYPHEADHKDEETFIRLGSKVPDVLLGSPERGGMRMEIERFQSATDVLARHYGVSVSKGQSRMKPGDAQPMICNQPKQKMPYNYMEDEDEIKV